MASLAEKQQVNEALLASGAPIQEMNIVRKHLSLFKGGRLAAAAFPASVMFMRHLMCQMMSHPPSPLVQPSADNSTKAKMHYRY